MPDTPFIGPSYALSSRPASVQRTVNMMPVPLEPGNERAGWVFKDVPGLKAFDIQPSGPSDPLFSSVFWLLPGSDNFVDYGPLAKGVAVTVAASIGPPQLNGKNTIVCPGTAGQSAQVASSPISGPFCIEGYFYSTIVSGQGAIFSSRNASAFGFMVYANAANQLQFTITVGGINIANPTGTFTPSTWTHFALNRDGAGNVQLFMNGVQSGATVVGANGTLDTGAFWCCGADTTQLGSINRFVGNISNLRVTLASRYTAAFTPPATPFPTH